MSDFNAGADSYVYSVQESIAFSGTELAYFTRRKADRLLDVIDRQLGDPGEQRALDVGCGIGMTDTYLQDRLGTLIGVDEASAALMVGAARNHGARYCAGDGQALPFATASVDLAFAICVVHHVAPDCRRRFLGEMRRVVRPGGLVVLFEHNPLNPATRVAVSRCELDVGVKLVTQRAAARLLLDASLEPIEARGIIYSTSERPWATRLEQAMGRVPIGAQHYVVGRR